MYYKVSIIVLTYNPIKKKLLDTLKSIIIQENISFQIVISDDGSNNNYFDDVERFFDEFGFYDFRLIASEINRGTVKNTIQAVKECTGKYVKFISPGDYFSRKDILFSWVDYLEKSGHKWSFGDAIYYKKNSSGYIQKLPQHSCPLIKDVYKKYDYNQCRWNYVVLDDIALGAAILCLKSLADDYLDIIDNKVIYAEDNIYRLMMFDGVVAEYFSEYVVFYEVGDGISTTKETVWRKRLRNDWKATDQIMLTRINEFDDFQKKIVKSYMTREKSNKYIWLIRQFFVRGRFKMELIRKFKKH